MFWVSPLALSRLHWRPWLPASTPHYKHWIDTGSTTERLKREESSVPQVEIVFQGWQMPSISEQERLALPTRQYCWVREVRLYRGESLWMYARSVATLAALQGPLRSLRSWNKKSLGLLLFNQKTIQRGPYQFSCFEPGSDQWRELIGESTDTGPQRPKEQWVRRSCFQSSGKPLLLLTELFF